MPRRTDSELITDIVDYLRKISAESISQGALCSDLKINSETANKWLNIILYVKENTPDLKLEKLGKFTLIRYLNRKPLFHISREDSLKKGVDPSDVSLEFEEHLSSNSLGLESNQFIKRHYNLQALLQCTKCGLEIVFPLHCGLIMEYNDSFLKCSKCQQSMTIPLHCDKEMGIKISKKDN
ncbi:MAG: hypothetical protein HeimC3_41340 [Candidatus Heimdallarchaeota archaeon LC_3]|nr:MAG: hypothetical protein HeimC3_41340 [Candidatus Heimdallarchaeota archaeon LC_3]